MREFVVVLALSLTSLPQAQCASPWQQGSPSIEIQQGTGYLGVGLLDVDERRAKELHLGAIRGAEVSRVEPGTPADKAGVHPGDVLLEFNGQVLESTSQLGSLVRETPPGHHAKLKIWREGKLLTLLVTIEARKVPAPRPPDGIVFTFPPPAWELPNPVWGWKSGMIGVECEPLSSQLADYFGVKNGVLVRTVVKNAPADHAGLKAGDVITRVGDKPVNSAFDLTSCLRSRSSKTVVLGLTRDHKEITLTVTTEESASIPDPARTVAQQ